MDACTYKISVSLQAFSISFSNYVMLQSGLERQPKFSYYCLHLIVLLLGQLGTFAMEMLLSDFELLAVLHRLILIVK